MKKADLPGQARARRGVEQVDAAVLEHDQRGADVGRLEAQVMQALAASGQEASDRRRRAQRLQQLDLAVAGGEQRGAHALIHELGLPHERQPENVAVEGVGFGQTLHHDSDVMNPSYHSSTLIIGRMPRGVHEPRRSVRSVFPESLPMREVSSPMLRADYLIVNLR